jgi:cytochrome c oxidase subunit III
MEIPYAVQPRRDTGLYNAKVGIWLFLASEVMLFGALFSSYILLRVGSPPENWPHGLLNVPIGAFNTTVLIVSSVTVVMAWVSLKMKQFGRFKVFQTGTVLCALMFLGIKSYEYHEKFVHYEVWKTDGTRITGHLEGHPMFLTLDKVKAEGKDHIVLEADPHHYTEGRQAMVRHTANEPHKVLDIPVSEIKRLSAYVPAHSTYFAVYFTLTALHALHVLGGAIVIGYLLGPGSKLWKTDPERLTNRVEVSGLFWHFVDLVWIFLFPVLYLL